MEGELPFKQRQKSVSSDSSSTDKVGNDILPDLIVARNNERPCYSCFLHFDVAALLSGVVVTQCLKYADEFLAM